MKKTREDNDNHYLMMLEFRKKQAEDEEQLRERNKQAKANRNVKYQEMKAAILRHNQEDYKRIRE